MLCFDSYIRGPEPINRSDVVLLDTLNLNKIQAWLKTVVSLKMQNEN